MDKWIDIFSTPKSMTSPVRFLMPAFRFTLMALGAFGEKKGRVISFDTADVEIDEEEFECTAEDLCRPLFLTAM